MVAYPDVMMVTVVHFGDTLAAEMALRAIQTYQRTTQ
jgi:hypothetical protein